MNYESRDSLGMYTSFKHSESDTGHEDGPGPHLMGADTLIGNDVYNKKREKVGDIKEIMLDMRDGRVSYAVLEFGGFLGMGASLFAIPWQALTLDTERKCFVLDVSKESLKGAPGFEKDKWPNMVDPVWEKGIHDYYGTSPYNSNI